MDPNGNLLFAAHDDSGAPGFGVWRYDGSQWQQIFDDDFAVDIAVDPTDPQRIAVTTSDDPFRDESQASGVYLTENGGLTWQSINDGWPMLRGPAIEFNPHDPSQLVLGTTGRGFFMLDFGLVSGDFNNDGLFNCADIDALTAAIAGGNSDLSYDMNGDGLVNLADVTDPVDGWLAVGGANNPDETGGNAFRRAAEPRA